MAFLGYLAHAVLPSIAVLYMGYRYGWDTASVGLMLAGVGVAAMIVQGLLIRPLTARFGERMMVLAGLLCGAVGFAVYGVAPQGWIFCLGIPIMAFWGLAGPASQHRAGVGKSEIGDLPAHGEQSAKDLRVLLEKLSVPKPYILIGHSYGGMVVRLYASLYPEDMWGLILEDTQHEDNLIKMREILTGKDLEAFDDFMGERLRTPENPVSERDYSNMTRDELRKSGPLPRMPFVVLVCAGRAKAMKDLFSVAAIERLDQMDNALNKELAALIPGGRLIMVEGTGHLIHVDKPGILIARVMEIIEGIRKKE